MDDHVLFVFSNAYEQGSLFVTEVAMLEFRCRVVVVPSSPFHFDATFHKPDHFPSADNVWEPGIRWQTMLWQGVPLGLKFEMAGTVNAPKIDVSVWSEDRLDTQFFEGFWAEVAYRYQWWLDLTEFYQRFQQDRLLEHLLRRWRGMRPLNHSSLYEYLMIAIVLQNATVRRSVNMMQALFETYGTRLAYDGQVLFCFWSPEEIAQVSEQELRELKVGYRAKSIKRVTDAFVEDRIDEMIIRQASKDMQRTQLLDLYGIGPASVGYILSDVFHHLDELDYISPWEQKIYSKLFFDTPVDAPVSTDRLLDFFRDRFGEYRMLAVHYIWEDLFWKRKQTPVEWLEKLIRL
ncbi:MAG: DNA-3-methyladenine glycosylase family protein [Candidatus Odinarchaeota archaeon]